MNPLLACVGSAGASMLAAIALGLVGPSAAAPPAGAIAAILPGQGGSFGTIKGRLVWGGASAPVLPLLVKKGDPGVKDCAVCAAADVPDRSLQVDPATKGVAHGFAYLVGATLKAANPAAATALLKAHPTAVIDQKGCEFLPYSTALLEAQPVTFRSSDAVGHNVRYTGSANGSKNIALPPRGVLANQKLKAERRPLAINCDIHPWMKGWIMVFDHPFFAVTAADGSFAITGVPAGTQNLVVWQEKVGYVNPGGPKGLPVTIRAGAITDVGTLAIEPTKVRGKK